ncbi:hypothetical protein CPC16_009136 [Podila verticillata]|nr:hypothetical protein BGZ59_007453 [Podila verticillata]KAF9382939.1 hypothetical protein CPC16_009136 [Podila verticillata]KFH66685.1 hypothetical protein MVEG_07210 [Podila verticillata NRRL 6337]
MSEIDAALMEKMEDYNTKVEKIDLELAAKRNEMMLPLYEERRKIIADVKHFWLTVFRNHMGLSQIIEEEDVPVLEHLTDVWVKHDPKEIRSFDIVFTFSDNGYFTNKELVKKVVFKNGEQVAEPFTINWKDGKDLTKSKRKKGADDDVSDSFFSYFKDEDITIAHFIANELFPDALSAYANDDDEIDFEDDDSEDEGSVDLSGEDDDEEEEEPTKKKNKK